MYVSVIYISILLLKDSGEDTPELKSSLIYQLLEKRDDKDTDASQEDLKNIGGTMYTGMCHQIDNPGG